MLLFFFTLVGSVVGLNTNRYTVQYKSSTPDKAATPSHSELSVSVLKRQKLKVPMNTPEIISKAFEIGEIIFSVKNTQYILYPLTKLVEKRGSTEKCLGYFSKVYVKDGKVFFEYLGGEKTVNMSRYSAIIEFIPSPSKKALRSYRNKFGELTFVVHSNIFYSDVESVTVNAINTGGSKRRCVASLFSNTKNTENSNEQQKEEETWKFTFEGAGKDTLPPFGGLSKKSIDDEGLIENDNKHIEREEVL